MAYTRTTSLNTKWLQEWLRGYQHASYAVNYSADKDKKYIYGRPVTQAELQATDYYTAGYFNTLAALQRLQALLR